MNIERTVYKGMGAWKLSDTHIEAILTNYGAKFQSLRYRGREMLVQSANISPDYIVSDYGSSFEKGEFSGFDQMFPNVSAGAYPVAPWQGVELPDHGEVWSRLWESDLEDGRIALRIRGCRLPYELEMRIQLNADGLEINYRALNLSEHDMDYIWCCHAQFVLEDGMRIAPAGARDVFNAAGGQKYMGAYGDMHAWPVTNDGRDLRVLDGKNRCCNKYWLWNALDENRCALYYRDGCIVTLTAPVETVPYLGVWTDECGYCGYGMRCAAPEPATGAPDSLEAARSYGRMSVLPAGGSVSWWLRISFQTAAAD